MLLELWIIAASDQKTRTEMTHFYARDEQHARQLAQSWLEQRDALPLHEFRRFPQGFRFGFTTLPGYQSEPWEKVDELSHS